MSPPTTDSSLSAQCHQWCMSDASLVRHRPTPSDTEPFALLQNDLCAIKLTRPTRPGCLQQTIIRRRISPLEKHLFSLVLIHRQRRLQIIILTILCGALPDLTCENNSNDSRIPMSRGCMTFRGLSVDTVKERTRRHHHLVDTSNYQSIETLHSVLKCTLFRLIVSSHQK